VPGWKIDFVCKVTDVEESDGDVTDADDTDGGDTDGEESDGEDTDVDGTDGLTKTVCAESSAGCVNRHRLLR